MANIYKSNYTGVQVDAAIEKVLKAAPESGDALQKKLKEGTNITISTDGTISATIPDTTYSVVEITSSQTILTDEQYNTLIASPFNKIGQGDILYDLYSETSTDLIYTANYLNAGYRITINKSTKAIAKGSLTSLSSHYTAKIVMGDSTTSTENASTTNGNTYIKLVDGGVRRSYNKIQGGGATTVASDANGNITITSTDTDTKVTSVTNHYTPSTDSASEISKDASSTTAATWGTTSLVTGVNIQRDEKGHVTGMTLDSIKMPTKPESGGSTLPFILLSGSSTEYPITGIFTDEQANLLFGDFSVISFTPSGLPDTIPLLPQTSEKMHYEYIYQGSDDTYTYTLTATLHPVSSPGTGWNTKSYTITRTLKTTTVISLGGKTGVITLGSGLSISSDNVLSSIGSSGSSSIEIIDLGDIGSFPASGSLTTEQLNKFVSWGNNGVNAVKIYDQTESGGTYPIMILNGNYQNRTFIYTGIWEDNKYTVTVALDNQLDSYSPTPTSGTYYITKTVLSGGSSSTDNEQKAYLGASFQFSPMIGQTSYVSTNVDSSVAGLTDAEITGLIFDCSYSSYYSPESPTSYSYQIKLNDLYRMFTTDSMGVKSASLTLFDQKFSLVFSDISTSYSQGTVNYNIPLTITPVISSSDDVLTIDIGFTYKGFKFANGGTY